jgi:hypothetical protein
MEDDLRCTRIGRCYSRLWKNGHVEGSVFFLSFSWLFLFFSLSSFLVERIALLFFGQCVRLGPGSVAESHRWWLGLGLDRVRVV